MKRYLIIMTTYPNAIEFISIKRNTPCLSAYRRVLSGAITFTYLLSFKKKDYASNSQNKYDYRETYFDFECIS